MKYKGKKLELRFSFSNKKVMVGCKFSYTKYCMKFKAKKLKTCDFYLQKVVIFLQSKCPPPRPNISHNTKNYSLGAIWLYVFGHHTRVDGSPYYLYSQFFILLLQLLKQWPKKDLDKGKIIAGPSELSVHFF